MLDANKAIEKMVQVLTASVFVLRKRKITVEPKRNVSRVGQLLRVDSYLFHQLDELWIALQIAGA